MTGPILTGFFLSPGLSRHVRFQWLGAFFWSRAFSGKFYKIIPFMCNQSRCLIFYFHFMSLYVLAEVYSNLLFFSFCRCLCKWKSIRTIWCSLVFLIWFFFAHTVAQPGVKIDPKLFILLYFRSVQIYFFKTFRICWVQPGKRKMSIPHKKIHTARRYCIKFLFGVIFDPTLAIEGLTHINSSSRACSRWRVLKGRGEGVFYCTPITL